MPIQVTCPHCQAPALIEEQYVGVPLSCPTCAQNFVYEQPAPKPPASPPRPPAVEKPRAPVPPSKPAPPPPTPRAAAKKLTAPEKEAAPPPAPTPLPREKQPEPFSVRGQPLFWLDLAWPRASFLVLVTALAIPILLWVGGLAASGFSGRFLATPAWQVQPLLLAACLLSWRWFLANGPRQFLRGCQYLQGLPEEEARQRLGLCFGLQANLLVLALALPPSLWQLYHVFGEEYQRTATVLEYQLHPEAAKPVLRSEVGRELLDNEVVAEEVRRIARELKRKEALARKVLAQDTVGVEAFQSEAILERLLPSQRFTAEAFKSEAFVRKLTENPDFQAPRVGPPDLLLAVCSTLEWFALASIIVLLGGLALVNQRTLQEHSFKAPIELALHEKHYRFFLHPGALGASVLLLLGLIVCGATLWTSSSSLLIVGVGLAAGALATGFVLARQALRQTAENEFAGEVRSLDKRLSDAARSSHEKATLESLHEQMLNLAALVRVQYVDRLKESLGQHEGRGVALRLGLLAVVVLWRYGRLLLLG